MLQVMYVPESLRRLMKCALEMATMATISHPNIVRVYSCLTDMVEETGIVPLLQQQQQRIFSQH